MKRPRRGPWSAVWLAEFDAATGVDPGYPDGWPATLGFPSAWPAGFGYPPTYPRSF